jgi:DNA-directed RNA polymerase specialized sigma24 family protein
MCRLVPSCSFDDAHCGFGERFFTKAALIVDLPYMSPRAESSVSAVASGPASEAISAGETFRDGGPAAMSSIKITSLDRRLYAWLGESDEKRFELAFNAYFSIAFPAVVRHLLRISRWDPSDLEDLAQDALLRLFDRLGRSRREASQSIERALECVRPLTLGPFHEREVNGWKGDVASFRRSAMGFGLPRIEQPTDWDWQESIRDLAERIPRLQRQGCHILHTVRLGLHWDSDEREAEADVDTGEPLDAGARVSYASAKAFAKAVVADAAGHSERLQAAVGSHHGLVPFVEGTSVIVDAVPRLRVPTNSYLFEIAMTIYLDERRKRGRQKRGGRVAAASELEAAADEGATDSRHPVVDLKLDSAAACDGEECVDRAAPAMAQGLPGSAVPAVDPTPQYENEDLFERFYEYLRKPVEDAARACAIAAGTRRASAERHKLDSLTRKLQRITAVLGLMGEGYTQAQIAAQLDLSRNQVKYVVELVQEAYERFAAHSMGSTARAFHRGVNANAP